MPILVHVHQLFSAEQCHAYIYILRWKGRLLHCPRCHSHNVGPWGTYHYRPDLKRYRCKACRRTFNDLTQTLLAQSKQSLSHWILATFCCACRVRPGALPESWGSTSGRATAGVGGSEMWRCPMRRIANAPALLRPTNSIIPLGTRAKPSRVAKSTWDVGRAVAGRSVSPAGVLSIKTGPRSSRGSAAKVPSWCKPSGISPSAQ